MLCKGSPQADCLKNFRSKECKQVQGTSLFWAVMQTFPMQFKNLRAEAVKSEPFSHYIHTPRAASVHPPTCTRSDALQIHGQHTRPSSRWMLGFKNKHPQPHARQNIFEQQQTQPYPPCCFQDGMRSLTESEGLALLQQFLVLAWLSNLHHKIHLTVSLLGQWSQLWMLHKIKQIVSVNNGLQQHFREKYMETITNI